MATIKEAALNYKRLGYTPIALNGKVPVHKKWQDFRGGAIEPSTLDEWFTKGVNVGIVTGEASNNLVVIDFDDLGLYAEFVRRFPELEQTYTVLTGSEKGMHVYFKVTDLPPTTEVKGIGGDKDKNIELKANGRQVVAPPSIHPETHKEYLPHRRVAVMELADMGNVVDWIQSFQEDTEWNPPTNWNAPSGKDPVNPAVMEALRAALERQPRTKHKGDWINTSCPNASAHKNGDKTPTFGYNTVSGFGHCFRCGTLSAKVMCEHLGIDIRTLGGFYLKSQNNQPGNGQYVDMSQPPPISPRIPEAGADLERYGTTRQQALNIYTGRLLPSHQPVRPPVVGPLRCLYKYKGMCRVISPGKLIAVVASSGQGKTSCLETIGDNWNLEYYNGIVWSPEWTGQELTARAIQRRDGISMDQILLHEVAMADMADGIMSNPRGILLTDEQRNNTMDKVDQLGCVPGEMFYLDNLPELRANDFKDLLPDLLATLWRTQRRQYHFMLLDYAQLMHACESKETSMYQMIMQFKQACFTNGLVAAVATQVTKADTRNQGNATPQLLDASSARFVNEDAFNLFVTLNLEEQPPGGGAAYSTGVLNVVKNSTGLKGKVRVLTDLAHLAWLDQAYIDQSMDMYR